MLIDQDPEEEALEFACENGLLFTELGGNYDLLLKTMRTKAAK